MLLLTAGCAEGTASLAGVALVVSGSTSYRLESVGAYGSNNGTNLDHRGWFNIDVGTLSISDNGTYTLVRNGAGCVSTESGVWTYGTNKQTSTLSQRSITNVPSGACSFTYNITSGGANFTPSSWGVTLTAGTLTDVTYQSYHSTIRLGLRITDTNATSGDEYLDFIKQ